MKWMILASSMLLAMSASAQTLPPQGVAAEMVSTHGVRMTKDRLLKAGLALNADKSDRKPSVKHVAKSAQRIVNTSAVRSGTRWQLEQFNLKTETGSPLIAAKRLSANKVSFSHRGGTSYTVYGNEAEGYTDSVGASITFKAHSASGMNSDYVPGYQMTFMVAGKPVALIEFTHATSTDIPPLYIPIDKNGKQGHAVVGTDPTLVFALSHAD
ncbi:MAG: hypothetical protein HOE53_01640 [Candidatus Magasanikbacteria bacterium]|jgi:hypothetical protein|nr:hypothetical protein [Candidatus Magasanikbacteria bacterium]